MMGAARLSALFALSCVFWAGGRGQEKVQVLCDDKDVEAAVDLALVKYNGMLTQGNKVALYQITQATKVQNESGSVLSVYFTSRESDCPVGGDKAWRECDYLPSGSEVPRPCQAQVSTTDARQEVLFVDCAMGAPVVRERAPCMGCPQEIDLNSEDLKEPLSYALADANNQHNSLHLFILKEVTAATGQVIAGFRYRLQFDMQKSNCTKADFREVTDECRPHEDLEFMHCNSTVDVAPWRHEVPDAHGECAQGLRQNFFTRRRPPGWSPLRSYNNLKVETQAKESSEESQERTMPTTSLSLGEALIPAPGQDPSPGSSALPPTNPPASPSNCPAKPWKEFVPAVVPPPPATNAPQLAQGMRRPFSDFDLFR